MNITEINDCLSELPEISILEFFRPRSPISGPFNWGLCEKGCRLRPQAARKLRRF